MKWTDSIPVLIPEAAAIVRDLFTGPVRKERFDTARGRLLSLFSDAGYMKAQISPRDFVLRSDTLHFVLIIDPGPAIVVTGWEYAGLKRTDTGWLARVLVLPEQVVWTHDLAERVIAVVQGMENLKLAAPPAIVIRPGDSTGVVWLRFAERPPAAFDGLLTAAGSEGQTAATQLSGRLSLGLHGLFGRDRTLNLRYERPQTEETLLRIGVAERHAFAHRIDWSLAFEEWERRDHRQSMALAVGREFSRQLRAVAAAHFARLTPGSSTHTPARTIELTLGAAGGKSADDAPKYSGSESAWSVTAAWSTRRETAAATGTAPETDHRARIDLALSQSWVLGRNWFARMRTSGRYWPGAPALAPGDEWFLGGAETMRGYSERAVIAGSGLIGLVELAQITRSGLGLAVFGEWAELQPFNPEIATWTSPQSYGLAMLLWSRARTGRLEVAWRDGARWRDGLLRLSVVQGW